MISAPLLDVQNLSMSYPLAHRLTGRKLGAINAVTDVSFSIQKGQTFGLVGESGCGKTTTGKCVLRIARPTGGRVLYDGVDLAGLSAAGFAPYRRKLQLIFQDPYSSLDPRQSLGSIVREAVVADDARPGRAAVADRVAELFDMVGLDRALGDRYPHEVSGGQRQRLGIARALACEPDLIVCDEPVSALDVSIQAQIINLFRALQRRLGLTYLFVAHDLAVVRHVSDVVGVMYLGRLVEVTPAAALYDGPLHPYTQALLSAVPVVDYAEERARARIVLAGEVPSALDVPTGCPFHPRCARATAICREQMPPLAVASGDHLVACHHAG